MCLMLQLVSYMVMIVRVAEIIFVFKSAQLLQEYYGWQLKLVGLCHIGYEWPYCEKIEMCLKLQRVSCMVMIVRVAEIIFAFK